MNGRRISESEVDKLRVAFGARIDILISIFQELDFVEACFNLSDDEDKSGFGAAMQIMTPKEQIEEAFQLYPGMLALNENYIPIGKCLKGSGDPYFVKENDSVLQVYRIRHDSIEDDKVDDEGIEYVCPLMFLKDKL